MTDGKETAIASPGVQVAVAMLLLVCALGFAGIFRSVWKYDCERTRLINEAVEEEAESVTLPVLPYSDFYWRTIPPSTEDGRWMKRFKAFYGIPEKMEVYFA